MAPTPQRIAQTSTELKKQYKKNGGSVTERQQKQLERGHDLDLRASRAREAEQRRRAALQKRKEREEKEKAVRKQLGVGLATQMIGYSHTQAQLKNGMEAFLGVKQRKEEEKRRKELELTKKLELIAQEVEKEPWDDDDAGDVVIDMPELPMERKGSIDDGLVDEALIEAHDIVTSDPIEPPGEYTEHMKRIVLPPEGPLLKIEATKDDAEFTRLHGPVNKAIEKVLEQLPEPLIELLSQDISMKIPAWEPAPGLLHKLNPLGLPPHRLRVKLGSVVVLLRDLNTSSQLSKSQHLRILRAENDRLECLVLDGQLEGTKALLTRVPFLGKYRNEDQYPFQRTQFPVRIAVDYKGAAPSRETSQSGFKMPAIPGRSASLSLGTKAKARPRPSLVTSQCNTNPGFKLPGLPASKVTTTAKAQPLTAVADLDCWEDFLGSGTQIARELSPDVVRKPVIKKQVDKPPNPALRRLAASVSLPPFSTQDLDFSMDELEVDSKPAVSKFAKPTIPMAVHNELLASSKDDERPKSAPPRVAISSKASPAPPDLRRTSDKALSKVARHPPRREDSDNSATLIDLANLRASQKPPSVSDRPGLKRKNWGSLPEKRPPPSKRHSLSPVANPTLNRPPVAISASKATKSRTSDSTRNMFDEFMMSTQEAASFFDDDDDLSFGGSPPIAV